MENQDLHTFNSQAASLFLVTVRVLSAHRVLPLVLLLGASDSQLVRQTRVLGHVLETCLKHLLLEGPRDDRR